MPKGDFCDGYFFRLDHSWAHPTNHGEIGNNIYLLGMENKGLLALARSILPQELLDNFEVVRIDERDDLISIHLNEVAHHFTAPI